MNDGGMFYIVNIDYDRILWAKKRQKVKEKQSFLKAKKRRK